MKRRFKSGDIVSYNGQTYKVLGYGPSYGDGWFPSKENHLWVLDTKFIKKEHACYFPSDTHSGLELYKRPEVKSNKPSWF